MLDCKRMVDIIPTGVASDFVDLYQLWKINLCSNCSSASCKHGGKIGLTVFSLNILISKYSRSGREVRHQEASQCEGKKWRNDWDNLRHKHYSIC